MGASRLRQSDRLVAFTAPARERRSLSRRPAKNVVTPSRLIQHLCLIPWSAHPYVALLFCRIERKNSSAASAYTATSRPVLLTLAPSGGWGTSAIPPL